jgi:hypothetical protein
MMKRTFLISTLILSSLSFAQTSVTTTTTGKVPSDPASKKLGLIADLSFSSNFEADGNVDKSYGSALSLAASYKLPQDFTISKTANFEKSFVDDREQKIVSSYFGLSRPIYKFDNEIAINSLVRAYMPYNADDRQDKGYNGGIYLRPSLVIPLSVINVDPLTFTFQPIYTQSFNDFATDNQRNILIERRFTQTYLLDYAITDKLSAGLTVQYVMAWDYRGNRAADKYLHEESLSYTIGTGFDVYVSHGITDEAFAPNGTDNNIEFASRDSEMSLGFTYTY